MKLSTDKSRCAGRFDFAPDGIWCDRRDTCARYKAFSEWDKTQLSDYQHISAFMAKPDCEDFIDVNEGSGE